MIYGLPKNFNLGYACINTKLEKECIFTSRTMRLKTYLDKGINYAKELAMLNLNDVMTIMEWNVRNNIHFFR